MEVAVRTLGIILMCLLVVLMAGNALGVLGMLGGSKLHYALLFLMNAASFGLVHSIYRGLK